MKLPVQCNASNCSDTDVNGPAKLEVFGITAEDKCKYLRQSFFCGVNENMAMCPILIQRLEISVLVGKTLNTLYVLKACSQQG